MSVPMIIGIDARPLLHTPRTGIGEFTFELLSHLFAQGSDHEYVLFANAFHASQTRPCLDYPNVRWVQTKIPNKLLHSAMALSRYPYLDRLVAREAGVPRLDVWYAPNLHITSVSPDIRYILTVHDISFYMYPSFFSPKARLWHRVVRPRAQVARADHIVVPSAHTKRDLEHTFHTPSSDITVVSPGVCSHIRESVDQDMVVSVQKKYELPPRYLLYLGTLEPRKNIDGICEAYRRSSLYPQVSLIVAGSLGHRGTAYRRTIEQTPGARYIGYVEEEEKHALYIGARAFLYPSLYEGFGFPVLEALRCGTPAIVSNRTSLPDVGGGGVLLVNPLNISAIQEAMHALVEDDALHTMLASRGQTHARAYSWDHAANMLLQQCLS